MNAYVHVSDNSIFTLDAAFWLGMGVIEHGIRNGIQHPLPPWAPRRRRWPKAVRAAPSARAPRHGIRNGIPNGIRNGIPNGIPNYNAWYPKWYPKWYPNWYPNWLKVTSQLTCSNY